MTLHRISGYRGWMESWYWFLCASFYLYTVIFEKVKKIHNSMYNLVYVSCLYDVIDNYITCTFQVISVNKHVKFFSSSANKGCLPFQIHTILWMAESVRHRCVTRSYSPFFSTHQLFAHNFCQFTASLKPVLRRPLVQKETFLWWLCTVKNKIKSCEFHLNKATTYTSLTNDQNERRDPHRLEKYSKILNLI